METLGAFVQRKRDELDMSLREFARQIGYTAPFVSDIERGRRNPSDDVLAEIARVLKVSVEELRKRDARAPIDDIKRMAQSDPKFAMAFRTVIDKNISAEQLLKWAQEQAHEKPKKK
jgi:transcriptional regulator with XRE-family HTH domain